MTVKKPVRCNRSDTTKMEGKVHVDVTLFLRGKQRLYGVPNGEFLRYAEYCTRRITRLRTLLRKDPMTAEGMKGPQLDLSPDKNQNISHMQIALLKADGVWARYRYLKMTAEKPARRAHALSRLRKCQKLWQLCHDCAVAFCDEQTQLEVDAFQGYAKASLELELGKWKEALTTFSGVLSVFEGIKEASNDTVLCGFCHDVIEDISPLIDFCKFNIGDSEDSSVSLTMSGRAKEIFSSLKVETTRVKQLTELAWRDKVIPIVHEGLRTKMATVVGIIEETRRADATLDSFDKLIAEAHGARQLIHTVQQKSDSEELRTMDEYLKWNSLMATIERSKVVLSTYKTPSERAGLASRTHTRITDLRKQFEDDKALEALESIWHTIKLMYIAEVNYGPQRIGLLDRARTFCDAAVQLIQDEGINDPPSLAPWASELLLTLRKSRINALAELNNVKLEASQPSTTPFLDDLGSFSSCPKLAEVPPAPKLVTPKPAIFNIAEDFLEYPSLKDKTNKKAWFKFW